MIDISYYINKLEVLREYMLGFVETAGFSLDGSSAMTQIEIFNITGFLIHFDHYPNPNPVYRKMTFEEYHQSIT